MERWNWAVLGLMGIVTALGLTTSSGAGKTKPELADNEYEVVACPPLDANNLVSDAAPIELASNVPAATHTHAGCSACQAKHASASDTAKPESRSKAFDELVAMIQSTVKPSTGNLVSGECLGNCQETGVCCDKSLNKGNAAVAAKTEAHCEGECLFSKKAEVVASLDQATAPRSPALIESHPVTDEAKQLLAQRQLAEQQFAQDQNKLEMLMRIQGSYETAASQREARNSVANALQAQHATTDCPLAKAADAFANLTKNFVCEGGECLTKQGHGTLTITAVEPATKPEGLLNLVAAGEVAAATQEPVKTEPGVPTGASTITITNDGLTKAGSGTLTLSIKAADGQPAAAATTLVEQFKAAEAKPVIDTSRAAARAAKLAKLEAKMEAPWMWEFERVSFEELEQVVQTNLGVPLMVDRKAIEDAAYDTASIFKIEKQPEMEAGEYLRLKLGEHGMTWIIPASNDCVLLTTVTKMENTRLNRVFDVTDLVNDADFDGDDLVKRIESLVQPESWRSNGGPGELAVWRSEKRLRLMSSNNYWVQREVAALLEDLRLQGPKNADHAVQQPAADPVAVLRRYELPMQPAAKDPLDRQKMMQAQQVFLMSVLRDLPQFSPEVFVAAEYNLRPVLVTKQLPEVHQKIKQRLKELDVQRLGSF